MHCQCLSGCLPGRARNPELRAGRSHLFGVGLILLLAGHLFQLHADTVAVPSILQQPVNSVATTNEDMAFGVVANGTPPLTFQWLFNGAALTGATNSSLLMTNLALTQSGNYS